MEMDYVDDDGSSRYGSGSSGSLQDEWCANDFAEERGGFKLATYNDAILSDDADVISLNAYSTCPLEAAIRRKTTNKSAYVNDILSALA